MSDSCRKSGIFTGRARNATLTVAFAGRVPMSPCIYIPYSAHSFKVFLGRSSDFFAEIEKKAEQKIGKRDMQTEGEQKSDPTVSGLNPFRDLLLTLVPGVARAKREAER